MTSTQRNTGITLDAALKALANPIRRQIVTTLLNTPDGRVTTCAALAVPVSKSTLTQHLHVLSECGIVETVDFGNRCSVELRSADLDQQLPGLLDLLRRAEATGR
jgi:DNA-binding transcriptional ArsR family regulator